jgi:hypothetical protein
MQGWDVIAAAAEGAYLRVEQAFLRGTMIAHNKVNLRSLGIPQPSLREEWRAKGLTVAARETLVNRVDDVPDTSAVIDVKATRVIYGYVRGGDLSEV